MCTWHHPIGLGEPFLGSLNADGAEIKIIIQEGQREDQDMLINRLTEVEDTIHCELIKTFATATCHLEI